MTRPTPTPSARPWRSVVALVAVLPALLAAGCALELDDPPEILRLTFCAQDFQCGQGELCEEGYCVVETDVRELIAIQLTPPNSQGSLVEQFPIVEIEQGTELPALQFQRPKIFEGTVTSRGIDGAPAVPIDASLILQRKSPVIDGLDALYQTQATAEAGFLVQLPSGLYDITVLPRQAGEWSPERLENFVIQNDSSQGIVLENQDEAVELTGRIIHTHHNTGDQVPVRDVRVNAIDGRNFRVSTLAITDEAGRFRLSVRSNARTVRVVADPIERDFLSLPRYVSGTLVLNGRKVEIGDLDLGVVDPIGRRIQGNLVALDDGSPVQNATIIFRGAVGDGALVRSTDTVDGDFSINLAAGFYTVQVIPDELEPFAITEFSLLEVPATDNPDTAFVDLGVQRKTRVQGRALPPDGRGGGLDGAVVQLKRLSVTGASGFNEVRTFAVRADSSGRYEALLDPGVYDVTIIPPDSAGHARSFIFGEEIGGAVFELDVFASRGNLARGDVYSFGGEALGDILVEIYRKDPERGPILMGSGRTDSQGRYRLLVPALRRQ